MAPGDRPTVLIVDDVPENLSLLANLLKGLCRTLVSTSGEEAISLARRSPSPDLILLDIVMPDLDGFEVCRLLKLDPATNDIPVIFLTAYADLEDEQAGLDMGAVDYITKPFNVPLVLARVKAQLNLKAARDFLKNQNAYLEAEVNRRTKEIGRIQDVTMVALGSLAETRDSETGTHIRRTQHFVRHLAEKVRFLDDFRGELTDEVIELLYKSAPLHDIGKVGIPDRILLKPGPLTPQEFEVMKTHTTLGAKAIEEAEKAIASSGSFLRYAREIALSHHERWDGSGYPHQLQGDSIPLAGRIMALADVYDALRSERVYKKAFSHAETTSLITKSSRGRFDPRLLTIFEQTSEEWKEIYHSFGS